MTFGAYQPCLFQSNLTPYDCLYALPKQGLIIKQGRAENRYVVIFRNNTGLPFIKMVDVVNGVFHSGMKQHPTFQSFLNYHRADVSAYPTINFLPLAAPVPINSQLPLTESEIRATYELIYDRRWFCKECNRAKAIELLQGKNLQFLVTYEKFRGIFTLYYTNHNYIEELDFTYHQGIVIKGIFQTLTFSSLLANYKLLAYTGINQ